MLYCILWSTWATPESLGKFFAWQKKYFRGKRSYNMELLLWHSQQQRNIGKYVHDFYIVYDNNYMQCYPSFKEHITYCYDTSGTDYIFLGNLLAHLSLVSGHIFFTPIMAGRAWMCSFVNLIVFLWNFSSARRKLSRETLIWLMCCILAPGRHSRLYIYLGDSTYIISNIATRNETHIRWWVGWRNMGQCKLGCYGHCPGQVEVVGMSPVFHITI